MCDSQRSSNGIESYVSLSEIRSREANRTGRDFRSIWWGLQDTHLRLCRLQYMEM